MEQNELNLNELGDYFPIGILTDAQMNELDGKRVKIAEVKTKYVKSKFGLDGKALPIGQTIDVPNVLCVTESVAKDVNDNDVKVTEWFGLKYSNGRWNVQHGPKAKSAKLFAKLGINRFEQAIGREIVLVKKVNPENPTKARMVFAL